MRGTIELHLTDKQIDSIERAYASGKLTVSRRAATLLLLHQGNTPEQVAEQIGVTVPTVFNTWRRFCAGTLEDRPRTGRVKLVDQEYRDVLHEETRRNYAQPFPRAWTTRAIAHNMETMMGYSISTKRLIALLKEEGFTKVTADFITMEEFYIRGRALLAGRIRRYRRPQVWIPPDRAK